MRGGAALARLAATDRGGAVTFGRVSQFGGWLRLRCRVPDGATLRVVAALTLKE